MEFEIREDIAANRSAWTLKDAEVTAVSGPKPSGDVHQAVAMLLRMRFASLRWKLASESADSKAQLSPGLGQAFRLVADAGQVTRTHVGPAGDQH